MKPPTRQGKAKELFWRKTLARFEESGLSQAEFCKRENLNVSNLSWWKREIAVRDARSAKNESDSKQTCDEREVYWRDVLARFEASGLSKDDFCEREGIKAAAFSWWRAELGRRDKKVAIPPAPSPWDLFVPIAVPAKKSSRQNTQEPQAIAEIDLVTGTMRLFDNLSAEALIPLLRAFREALQ